jgi:hypothetical protein
MVGLLDPCFTDEETKKEGLHLAMQFHGGPF